MSTDFVAALRAVANHMRKYYLDDTKTLSVEFNRHSDAVEVHAYNQDTFRAWRQSLKDVIAVAKLYHQDTVILDLTGGIPGAAVRVRFYADAHREADVFNALRALLVDPESDEFEPIELPEVLTRAAGGER